MIIPITKVKKILDALLLAVKTDYNSALTAGVEEESFLYRVLYGNAFGEYDFYEQGVAIFIRTDASARQLQTKMGFDMSPSQLPVIYVHQPNEVMKGVNTVGWGFDTNEFYTNSDGVVVDKLFRGYSGAFEYVITSPNVLETILIYEVLHAALNSSIDTLSEIFNIVTMTGKELVAKSEMMPEPLFLKTIIVDGDYVKEFPRLSTVETALLVEFNPAIVYTTEGIGNNLI
jgi:hypothetical protein